MSEIFKSTKNTRPILEGSLRFIRSDVPTEVSEEERLWLIGNRITTIVDLRTEDEGQRKKCPLEKDHRFDYRRMPVTGGNAIPESTSLVSRSYIAMVDDNLNKTIDFILNNESNVLYFCNAGKDRTGVVSAILLSRLGMDIEYIVGDYMRSRDNLRTMLEDFARANPSVDINVITPQESYVREFLDWYKEN